MPINVGNSIIGASFRFATTLLDDTKKVQVASQMVQSTYNAMLPPYSLVGIGKTNNYIESFNAAFGFKPYLGEQSIL
jgi:integrin alpha FG-GAP repeat containing protein 1